MINARFGHFIYRAGLRGETPELLEACKSKQEAINLLIAAYGDISSKETKIMRNYLQNKGEYEFRRPQEVGADFCRIKRCLCKKGPSYH